MKYILETERLRLREFILGDALFIVELLNSPGWIQFIGDRNIKSLQQAASYLENGPIKSYGDNGFGLWMVELKENETAIGMCGLIKRDGLENPDIGFAFYQIILQEDTPMKLPVLLCYSQKISLQSKKFVLLL